MENIQSRNQNHRVCHKFKKKQDHLKLSNVNPETGPRYRMNLLYLIEVLMGKVDRPYRQNR